MSIKSKVILITLLFAVPTLLTGKLIWPPDPMGPMPTSTQLPFFIVLGLFESVSFGLGMAFLFLGYPLLKKISGKSNTLTKLAFFSIAWYLINWWPHDNLHIHNGMDLQGLLYIEYGFHVTMIIAGSILALFFYKNFLHKAK